MCIFQSEQVIKLRNVLVSLETTSGHWIRQISKKNNWIIMCGTRCWDAVRNTCQNRPTLLSWRLPYHRYEMICHRSSLIRQSRHFKRDFDRVLLQLVECWTLSLNTERAAAIRHWNIWTEKVVQSLIRYYWIFRARLLVHLKKWTLNFKQLYLLNHESYFNKICRICDLNPRL